MNIFGFCLPLIVILSITNRATCTTNPDKNQVCSLGYSTYYGLHPINCDISDPSTLPSLQSRDADGNPIRWRRVNLKCIGNSNETQIALPRSTFQPGFDAYSYNFVYGPQCDFNLPPDLFDNVNISRSIDLKYDMRLTAFNTSLSTVACVNSSFTFQLYPGNSTRLNPDTCLSGSKYVTYIRFYGGSSVIIPGFFFHDMPNLSNVDISVDSGSMITINSHAFSHLSDLDIIIRASKIQTKAFSQLDNVRGLSIGGSFNYDKMIIGNVAVGAIDSINRIDNLKLVAYHDAFEGKLFSNVTQVGRLRMKIFTSNNPIPCSVCPVNKLDLSGPIIGSLKMQFINIVPIFEHDDMFDNAASVNLKLNLRSSNWNSDFWVGGILATGCRHVTSLDIGTLYSGSGPIFGIDFTTWSSLELVEVALSHRNASICDASWLTLPDSTRRLRFWLIQNQRPFIPLVVRGLHQPVLYVHYYYWDGWKDDGWDNDDDEVDCNCSISWIKQLLDCGRPNMDYNQLLGRPCRHDNSVKVSQFLSSTACCFSTDPPTLDNEPYMPLNCSSFLPIPPELLYFNHSDLPQCRESGEWQFDPCDVKAFYTGSPSITTAHPGPHTDYTIAYTNQSPAPSPRFSSPTGIPVDRSMDTRTPVVSQSDHEMTSSSGFGYAPGKDYEQIESQMNEI